MLPLTSHRDSSNPKYVYIQKITFEQGNQNRTEHQTGKDKGSRFKGSTGIEPFSIK